MLKQLIKPTPAFIIACSGGVDSMAVVDFYHRGGKDFSVAYFNHGTALAPTMEAHVRGWCRKNNREFLCGTISNEKDPKDSPEEFWRKERYRFLFSFGKQIVMAHHLNDAVETWVFSCLHGTGKLIPVQNGLILRPFLTTEKSEFERWCRTHDVSWVDDASNVDVRYPRNRIRHVLMPEILKINPGIHKLVRKKYIQSCM